VAEPVAIRYRAFLSYSHHDAAWAKWLHKALESYRIDKDLVGRETPLGPVPKTLRPIFRDREDFSGGHTLTDATVAALDASAALLVLCSTTSAARPAVNEEVRLFRSRHPDRPVIPVIIDGTPPDNFPPALRYELAADGTITDRPVTVLAPDFRDSGDGKGLGLAKVIAGLLGIGTDDIVRRAERARKRRNRSWAALAGVLLVLALSATASAVYAWHQLKTNEDFLNAALKRATDIVDEAVAQAEKYNVPRTATLALLGKAEGLFDDMARYGRPTTELRYRKASMLIQFARNYAILGDTGKQLARAIEAHRLLAELATEKPGNITYQEALALAFQEVGDVLRAQGRLGEALQSFREGIAITERLTKADPTNEGWQRHLAISHERVSELLTTQGDHTQAIKHLDDVVEIRTKLLKGLSFDKAKKLIMDDSTDQLATSHQLAAELHLLKGELTEALQPLRDLLAIREKLAKVDPGNAARKRDLSAAYNRISEVLMALGNLTEALKFSRDRLAIVEGLAKADANDLSYQHDLSVLHNRVGEVLTAQGNLTEALKAHHESLAIIERLAKTDPNNAVWQRDLAVFYDRVGGVLVAQGNLTEALKSFRDGLAIIERLGRADPNNADRQHDLAVSYIKVAYVLTAYGNLTEGGTSLRKALTILKQLDETARGRPEDKSAIASIEARLAELQEAETPRK
jgi:tetratricopeptide (TPR) repeat protein